MISSLCLTSRAYCLIVARTVLSLEYLKRITRIASMIFPVDHVFRVVSKGCLCVNIFRLTFNWLIDSCVICRIYPLPATKFTTSLWSSPWEANSSSTIREFPTFYVSLSFNTGFTKTRHLSVSWTRSFHSKPRLTPFCHHVMSCPMCGRDDRRGVGLQLVDSGTGWQLTVENVTKWNKELRTRTEISLSEKNRIGTLLCSALLFCFSSFFFFLLF